MQTPLEGDPPGCRLPWTQTPPMQTPSPGFRYSQQAGGTHPTGLHTYFVINLIPADILLQLTNVAIFPRTYMYQAYANFSETRMHSSWMRTTHSSTRLLWRGCLPQCMLVYPWVWAWRLETPPRGGPGDCYRCGHGDLPGQTPQLPSWVWAWRPARHAGIPPPWRPAGLTGIPAAMHAGIPYPL